MKIMTLKGVHPPKEGITLSRKRPISLISLQMSKGHPFAEKAKKSPSKPLKSESSQHAISIGPRSPAPTIPEQPKTTFPHILEPHPAST